MSLKPRQQTIVTLSLLVVTGDISLRKAKKTLRNLDKAIYADAENLAKSTEPIVRILENEPVGI